jgi:hypothetical protein
VTGWAAFSVGRSFGNSLASCGLPLMSALAKSMHLGRLPSRPPLPGSGGSQSGAKMRMGYVTRTFSLEARPQPLENGAWAFREAREGTLRIGGNVGGGLTMFR